MQTIFTGMTHSETTPKVEHEICQHLKPRYLQIFFGRLSGNPCNKYLRRWGHKRLIWHYKYAPELLVHL